MASATPGTEFWGPEQKSAEIGHNAEYDKGELLEGTAVPWRPVAKFAGIAHAHCTFTCDQRYQNYHFLADLLVSHFSDSLAESADSGISAKGAKSAPNGNENAGYRVSELLSMFTEAPKSSTSLKRKIGQINTDRDQLIDEASHNLVQILSHQFRGMDRAVIARVVEKVAETHRNKSHFEQSSPAQSDSPTSENLSPVLQTSQLRFLSPEGGTSNPMN